MFQKKWAPVKLHNCIHHGVLSCKQKIPLEEYQERRRNSPVVLGLFRNSPSVKQELFMKLEEQLSSLSDGLIQDLQQKRMDTTECRSPVREDSYDTL